MVYTIMLAITGKGTQATFNVNAVSISNALVKAQIIAKYSTLDSRVNMFKALSPSHSLHSAGFPLIRIGSSWPKIGSYGFNPNANNKALAMLGFRATRRVV